MYNGWIPPVRQETTKEAIDRALRTVAQFQPSQKREAARLSLMAAAEALQELTDFETWMAEAEARAADYADLKRTEEDARQVGLQ